MEVADQRLANEQTILSKDLLLLLFFGDIEEILRLGSFHRDLMAIDCGQFCFR